MAHHVARIVIVSITVSVMFGAGPGTLSAQTDQSSERNDRVRILTPTLRLAFDRGMSQSPTFVALVAHLRQSDVIVYLTQDTCPGLHVVGCVVSVNQQGGWRYVRINLMLLRQAEATALQLSQNRLIAQIGHELQHAVEVADDQSIVDVRSLERSYTRNRAYRNKVGYETDAAVQVGDHVLSDLTRHGSSEAPPPAKKRIR